MHKHGEVELKDVCVFPELSDVGTCELTEHMDNPRETTGYNGIGGPRWPTNMHIVEESESNQGQALVH